VPDDPFQSIFQVSDIEINEESYGLFRDTEVGQELSIEERQHSLYAFDFYYQAIVHEQIQSIATVQMESLVQNRERMLAAERDLVQRQFVRQTVLIGGFKETWSEITVDFESASNDAIR